MNSIVPLGVLAMVMAFCGLAGKSKPESASPGPERAAQSQSTPAAAKTPAQPDRISLQNELVKLEQDMTEAAMQGDITLLARNTTDDFELTGVDGKVQNKNQALADVKREKNIRSWSITEPELLSANEDSAVLRYIQNVTAKTGQRGRARVTDTFVKQGGQWLVKSEQQTMIH